MYKYMVLARKPAKFSLLWDYPDGYFPRRVFYKKDADNLAAAAKRKGGESVAVKDYTELAYRSAIRQLSPKKEPQTV